MSEDNVQKAPGNESSPTKDDQGVATQQAQDQSQQGEVGTLIADAKKYRQRAQKVESELAELKQKIETQRQAELEKQQEWQTLAEERANRIAELEPVVEQAQKQEAQMREQILSEFNEEDRETFGDLPLSKLQALHGKIVNTPKIPIANNPAVPVNELPGDWSQMNAEDRRKNWKKVLSGYTSVRK
tara:strand:- start:1158 stop:1715 length:558 start_codon:yes stop_codon:yes gene_type:complete